MLLSSVYAPEAKRLGEFLRLINSADALGRVDETAFTEPEKQLVNLGLNMISMIRHACDPEVVKLKPTHSNLEEWACDANEGLSEIQESVKAVHKLVDDDRKWIPTFTSTLHPLYTAYEAVQLTDAAAKYLIQWKLGPYEDLVAKIEEMKRMTAKICRSLKETTEAIHERLNDSPWLDFVLEEVQIDDPSSSPGMGSLITESLGIAFLENWAGDVVESWRESAKGLACLK
jgi:N-terminal acetyltransferase B complex non-catalytic subunit